MQYLEKVSELRKRLEDQTRGIKKKEGGVYCWWFKREVAQTLLKELLLTHEKHKPTAVKYGTVSTLRNTLGALLGKNMSESEKVVNDLMDNSCYWEWVYATDYKDRETNELSSTDKCYPLNIQENKTVSKVVLKNLMN